MQFNLLSKLFSINILSNVVPLLTIIVLKKAVSTSDFSTFVANYSLILFSISIIEFGFRNYFLTKSGLSILSINELISSDRIRLTIILILCFFIIIFSTIKENYFPLFFIPLIIKEYFFPIYKYQNLNFLNKYNFSLAIFQLIIIIGLTITLLTSEIYYLYYFYFFSGLYLSVSGYVITRPGFNLIISPDLSLIKKISPIGISNIVTSINQNLYKFLLGIISPIILVNFEIILKLTSIFKVPINLITEYFQIQSSELTKKKMIFFSLMIFMSSVLFFLFFKTFFIDFFDIDIKYLYVYLIVLIPITFSSLLHRVTNIISNKLRVQFISICLGTLITYLLTLYFFNSISLLHIIIISILSELTILFSTLIFNNTTYEKKI